MNSSAVRHADSPEITSKKYMYAIKFHAVTAYMYTFVYKVGKNLQSDVFRIHCERFQNGRYSHAVPKSWCFTSRLGFVLEKRIFV
jgi:hypothetical protein